MERTLRTALMAAFLLATSLAVLPTASAHDTGDCAAFVHLRQVKAHVLCTGDQADDHCTLHMRAMLVKVGIGCTS